jgi:hypothetical protein
MGRHALRRYAATIICGLIAASLQGGMLMLGMQQTQRRWVVRLASITASVLVTTASVLSAASVAPAIRAGNPTCADLGYAGEIKVDPPASGTYTNAYGYSVTLTTADGVHFDWTSTLGIDLVIAKGGQQGANLYQYDPPAESFGDTDLVAPNNPNGEPPQLSHVVFCFDYELAVAKTAVTTFTRTYQWSIAKSVSPAAWDLFDGDSGTSQYTVTVAKTGSTDSAWAVSGTISIHNLTPFPATLAAVVDPMANGFGGTLDCGGVSFPYAMALDETLTCTYSAPLPNGDSRTNTANITTSGAVGGSVATAAVVFGAPTTEVNAGVTVNDTNGSSWAFGDSGSVSYNRTFSCGGDQGVHGNTATIAETNQSASASVSVACHRLTASKTARTSLDRGWTWTIDKTADQTDLTLAAGQSFPVNYTVRAAATSTDSNWQAHGTISVHNPAPIAAVLLGVSDLVSGGYAGVVDCGSVAFPTVLAAGATLSCTYDASLPDASGRVNTATATQQNLAYAANGTSVLAGTQQITATAAVDFSSAAITESDECASVTDDRFGALGSVCAGDLPKVYSYTLNAGPFAAAECGVHQVVNQASFTTNDDATTGSDSWTVNVTVPCAGGCSLTPGYWKTHSQKGPAPYDDAWALLGPAQQDTVFFLSGKSYYQVLWTAPNGNAYFILAHAWIATTLNGLNDASMPPEVLSAWNEGTTLFSTYTPAQIGAQRGSQQPRKRFLELAGLLDMYNNGLIGPGHCSE